MHDKPQVHPAARGRTVVVIGAGFAGLTAACELRLLGYEVQVVERLAAPGGRAQRVRSDVGSCVHDAGPSWYWMPDIFESILARFNSSVAQHYNLNRLDPAYRLHLPSAQTVDVPGTADGFLSFALNLDPSFPAARFLREGQNLYTTGMHNAVWDAPSSWPPLRSWMLSASPALLLSPLSAWINKYTSNPTLTAVLSWPSQFLGMDAEASPALYAVLTHSGHVHGTWMPDRNGMAAPALALYETAVQAGVKFAFNADVSELKTADRRRVTAVVTADGREVQVDGVVAAADMAHVELELLPPSLRRHSATWWSSQAMTPNVTVFMLCVNGSLPIARNVTHHMYLESDPPFYASVTPQGAETAVFLLMPALAITSTLRTRPVPMRSRPELLASALARLGIPESSLLCGSDGFGPEDYAEQFKSWRGNAFGHANVAHQTMWLKPSMDSLAENLKFAGHLTHPGPGVPPSMISGIVAARLLHQALAPADLTLVLQVLLLLAALTLLAHTPPVSHALALHAGGRTYFAAASAMDFNAFMRIARLYSIFRAADDAVDCIHVPLHQRIRDLNAIEREVLAAPLGHSAALWRRFFAAMRNDTRPGQLRVRTTRELVEYMDGSAAVLGEFMMTELGATPSLLHSARALGFAFQVTNMARDVIEDAELGRQYVPQELCDRRGVEDLPHVAANAPSSPAFAAVLEDMFAMADDWYAMADAGIAALPQEVRAPIALARVVYHRLHNAIRERRYVLRPRVTVPWRVKLADALRTLPAGRVWRLPVAEAVASLLALLRTWGGTALALLSTWTATQLVEVQGEVTYAAFHTTWTLPFLLGLSALAAARRHAQRTLRAAATWTAALCLVAVAYTTPWDAHLIRTGVWASTAVSGTVLDIPLEEYAFFVMATVITCLAWLAVWPTRRWSDPVASPVLVHVGTAALIAMAATGAALVALSERTLYLGLLLVWAAPVLLLQWAVGAPILLAHAGLILRSIALSGGCMAIMDVWAIQRNIWVLNPQFSLWHIGRGLHVEEVAFFLLSSAMCSGGLTLAVWASHGYTPHLCGGVLQRFVEQAQPEPQAADASSGSEADDDCAAVPLDEQRLNADAARANRAVKRRPQSPAPGPRHAAVKQA